MSFFRSLADHDSVAGQDANLARRHGPRSVGPPGWLVEPRRRPFTWTIGNIVRAVLAVLAFVGVLVLAALERSRLYTMDTDTSRGTANAYFAALQRGDDSAAAELACAEPPMLGDGTQDVQQALGGGPPAPPEFELGDEEPTFLDPEDHVAFHFLVPRKVRGWVYVRRTDADAPWRVCGLLDVGVWVEDP